MSEVTEAMQRELSETYSRPDPRAAYRAGMSTAAAICDERAASVGRSNPGKKRGTLSQIGYFGHDVAKGCGDAIMKARETVVVRASTDQREEV